MINLYYLNAFINNYQIEFRISYLFALFTAY
jgi:hypothetical protein